MRILFSSNVSWSIYNFRLDLLKSLQNDGHQIYFTANEDNYTKLLLNEGMVFFETKLNNNSTNPIKDILLIFHYYKLYKKINPAIILQNAIKPNIYGTVAAGILNIPVINNISGLGTLFIKKSFSTRIAKVLYWLSQKYATKVFFQNPDDMALFVGEKLVPKHKTELIGGSGIDTSRFAPTKENKSDDDNINFLFVGRLLLDKGVMEYVEAARIIKSKYSKIHFMLLGPLYENNSSSISLQTLNAWINEKTITYLGISDDVITAYSNADCVVLPSYREGLSRVLLEASSMALPIITTDVPGCRDVIIDNITGYLCKPKDIRDLASKMEIFILSTHKQRYEMGQHGRKRAIELFDIEIVINKYKEAIVNQK